MCWERMSRTRTRRTGDGGGRRWLALGSARNLELEGHEHVEVCQVVGGSVVAVGDGIGYGWLAVGKQKKRGELVRGGEGAGEGSHSSGL